MTAQPALSIAPDDIAPSRITTLESPDLLPVTCFRVDSIPAFFIPETDLALSNEITLLAGHINAAQYRFLKLLAALWNVTPVVVIAA